MRALVTGASSGIGKEMAKYLSSKGIDLVLVARDEKKLEETKKELSTKVEIITTNLCKEENCINLHSQVKDIDILINNAGFGTFGKFTETDLNKEMNMIDTNIKALHILTKLYLKDMKEKNSGYILNVASIAAFIPGPLMATYYATKAYVLNLTRGIYEELRRDKSKVKITCLCPGPTKTNFLPTAGVRFNTKLATAEYVAKYAINNMFKGKLVIIPTLKIKTVMFLSKIVPHKLIARFTYKIQEGRK